MNYVDQQSLDRGYRGIWHLSMNHNLILEDADLATTIERVGLRLGGGSSPFRSLDLKQ